MEYLPTFTYIYHTFHLGQMLETIPYMEAYGIGCLPQSCRKAHGRRRWDTKDLADAA